MNIESTPSRQKKGQMKSIFLSDSDKEAIVEFVKQHKELYDKTNEKFKDKQRKEGLWERLAASRILSVNTVRSGSRLNVPDMAKAHSDEVRVSCWEEHRKTDLVEGQFQFSTRSDQKEGSV